MKILYFTNIPAPYRVTFFNFLSEKNDVTVLYNRAGKYKRDKRWFADNEFKHKSIEIPRFGLFKLNKILKEKYDVVVIGTYASINGAFLNLLLRMKKIKFYINADGGFVDENESFKSRFIKRFFLSGSNYYLSTGKGTNKYLTYYGAKEKNIYIYHFSSLMRKDIIDEPIPYEEKMILRKEAGYNYKRLFISVGRFIEIKGYDIFLKAIKDEKYKDTAFLIIGGGEEKENLENYIKENNIKNVFLIDFCDKNTIINYYKMSDVFFFNSKGDVWGLVINEAMSYGLPIISTNTTLAATELISEEYLYDPYDIDKIRMLINKLGQMTDEELYEIGKNNLEVGRKYTIEQTTEDHIEIFKKVIEEANNCTRSNYENINNNSNI